MISKIYINFERIKAEEFRFCVIIKKFFTLHTKLIYSASLVTVKCVSWTDNTHLFYYKGLTEITFFVGF